MSFDGSTYLQNPGTVARLPATSANGLFFVTYGSTNAANQQVLLDLPPADGYSNGMQVYLTSNNDGTASFSVSVSGVNHFDGTGTPSFNAWATRVPLDGNYHTVGIGWDAAAGFSSMTLDGAPLPSTVAKTGAGQSANFAGNPVYIAGGSDPRFNYAGELAELFFYTGLAQAIDPLSVLAGFYDAKHGVPARNGSNGTTAIPGLRPQIYLSGPPLLFAQNLTNDTTAMGIGTPDPNGVFQVVGDPLGMPAVDPWGVAAA